MIYFDSSSIVVRGVQLVQHRKIITCSTGTYPLTIVTNYNDSWYNIYLQKQETIVIHAMYHYLGKNSSWF